MTAIRFATSIVLGLVAATSAHAAEPDTAPVAVTTTATVAKAATTNPLRKVRYCLKSDATGSRIPRTECKSRSDWKAVGIDVDALIARADR